MKQYFDSRGHAYFVRAGLGDDPLFKAFCRKPDKSPGYGEHAYRGPLPWRETASEAQEDLDKLAIAKKWKEIKDERSNEGEDQ